MRTKNGGGTRCGDGVDDRVDGDGIGVRRGGSATTAVDAACGRERARQGKPQWACSIGGAPHEISYCVGISPAGEIYLALRFADTLLANDAKLTSRGRLDVLVGVLETK